MRTLITSTLRDAADAVARLRADDTALAAIEAAATALVATLRGGGRVFAAGNGGSMSEAVHFAEELTGRFRGDRPPLPALAISDPSYLSCVANDYGYDQVFARFLEAHARPGDLFVAFSTSGASPNLLRAAETARALSVGVVAVTGRADAPLAALAGTAIVTPAGAYADRVQELHLVVLHLLIDLVEHELFRETFSVGAPTR
jgi:D-sedoheptulose 7-phosphate isomerase